MAVTTDPIALGQWFPIAYAAQLNPGLQVDTMLLGQPIQLTVEPDGTPAIFTLKNGVPTQALRAQRAFTLLFTTLSDTPRPLPTIPEFDESDRRIVDCGAVGVKTSPFRIVENFLDMAHFCFVHTDILGSPDKTEVLSYRAELRDDVDEIFATDCRFFQPAASKSASEAGAGQVTDYTYRVHSPFSVMLYKSAMGYGARLDAISLFVQPKTETECIAYMPMALLDDVSSTAGMIDFQQTIFLQDRIILENQRPRLLPLAPRQEMPTRADLSSVVYRKWLKDKGMRFGLLVEDAAR